MPDRELHLGQQLYFVLWDEDADLASVARGEVVQYASDYSKVRVKVVDAPQTNLIGRTSWILPDRLDDDARTARVHYQQRAREGLREEMRRRRADPPAEAGEEGADTVGQSEAARAWGDIRDAWDDVDLLLDSIDFEAGWPEHQARLAKFAVLSVLRLQPGIEALLAALPDGDEARAVRAALAQGVLGSAQRLAGGDACGVLEKWSDLPFEEVGEAGEALSALRTALTALGERHELPGLGAAVKAEA